MKNMHSETASTQVQNIKNPDELKKIALLKSILPVEEEYFLFLENKIYSESYQTKESKKNLLVILSLYPQLPDFRKLPDDILDSMVDLLDERHEGRQFFLNGEKLYGENFSSRFSYNECKAGNIEEANINKFLMSHAEIKIIRTDSNGKPLSKQQLHDYTLSFDLSILDLSLKKEWASTAKALGAVNNSIEVFYLAEDGILNFIYRNRYRNDEKFLTILSSYFQSFDEDNRGRVNYIFRKPLLGVLAYHNYVQYTPEMIDCISTLKNKPEYKFNFIKAVLQKNQNLAVNSQQYFETKYPDEFPKKSTTTTQTTTTTQATTPFLNNVTNDSRKRSHEDDNDDASKKQRGSSPEPS